MSALNELAILFLYLITAVNCRHCTYIYESGYMKYFYCEAYEYCCGSMCCRSQAITFYQVWYFWLIVFMTLLLCSGGSWWYRFHNRDAIISTAPMGIPTVRAVGPHTGVTYGTAPTMAQPFYPQQQMAPQPMPQPPSQSCPPPPYYEPPPSYASVTNRTN